MSRTIGWIALFFCFTLSFEVLSNIAQAQTFTVLHTFSGQDGQSPRAHLTMDRGGNLYGTASKGGRSGGGTAFKLSRRNGSWIFSLLYSFAENPSDAAVPNAAVIAPDGSLYGSSLSGGGNRSGTVFRLRPPATRCAALSCPWIENLVYQFQGGSDGCGPEDIVFDASGDIVGATNDLNCLHSGTVYQLTPSGGSWTYDLLYAFDRNESYDPSSALVIDHAGNLYGTTLYGASGNGTVYQLSLSGSGWIYNTLYGFGNGTGAYPFGVILDAAGDLFGTTEGGGSNNRGTVFELASGSGGWAFNSVYNFTGLNPNSGPAAPLTIDNQGNLYGETYGDGAFAFGNVFKLTRSGNGWIYSDLHDFTNVGDGSAPTGQIVIDANGNLYGTASAGGNINECLPAGCGTLWEITP